MTVTVLRCFEEVGEARTDWTWSFFDDGSLLEQAPRGERRYTDHLVLNREHPLFQVVAAQDGALVRFEERVRAGRVAEEPTFVTVDGREYAVRATGTAAVAAREGPVPALAGWSTLADDDPSQNVYFVLESPEGWALGIWTRAMCLSFESGTTKSPPPRRSPARSRTHRPESRPRRSRRA